MGTIISRKKRTAVVTTQAVSTSETATPQLGNQGDTEQQTQGSHDDENESDTEEKSEASDKSDSEASEPENNDDEKQSKHDSVRSLSVSSRSESNESVEKASKNNKSTVDGAISDEEFNSAWRKALLEDLGINISDNVKIVRIFTSSTFTGKCEISRYGLKK